MNAFKETMNSGTNHEKPVTLLVRSRKGGYQLVNCKDIAYCKAEGSYTVLHLMNSDTLIIAKSLRTVNDMIGDNNMMRCHRSFLVNIEMVRELDRCNRTITVLEQAIPLSRRRFAEVLKKLRDRCYKGE